MKILYLINFAGKAGTEKYVENLIDYFEGDKCSCSLCYNIDGPLADKMRQKGIECYQLEMKNPFDLRAAKKLAQICLQNNIDVIHAQYPRENYIALLSHLFYNKTKVVFTSHLAVEQPLLWKFFNRAMTPFNHKIISVCNAGRDILISNGVKANKIEVVYNGINPALSPPHNRDILSDFGINDEFILNIMARYTMGKGLDFLLDVADRLKQLTDEKFKVLIIGDGELFEEIKQKIKDMKLSDTVLQLGYRTDTAKLLAASDIYLNTSTNEAMSFAILEALAAGLPIVATDVGGNGELVKEGGSCGFVSPYGDVDTFANNIKQLLENDSLRKEYRLKASDKAKNEFNLFCLLDKIYNIYKN